MFEREIDYWTIAVLGGGNSHPYNELKLLANRGKWQIGEKSFKNLLSRALEYGLITLTPPSCDKFGNKTKFKITDKGIRALQFYKYMRYHNSREYFRLKEEEDGAKNLKVGTNKRADSIHYDRRRGRYSLDLNRI